MSKPKSKPKRVEYVTAASYEILSDERDALEGALTDVEQERNALKADRDNLSKFAASKAGQLRELETHYHHLAVRFRQMCEYRDQWATQSAVWEEKAKRLEARLAWEQDLGALAIGKWVDHEIMLDAVCKALAIGQFEAWFWRSRYDWMLNQFSAKCEELTKTKRNVFSKLWHWFTDPPRDNQ